MIRAVMCDPADVMGYLLAIKSPKTDHADVIDLADIIARGRTFRIVAPSGETVGAYVLAAFGPLLWVMAAGGQAAFDVTRAILALVEVQAAGFEEIGFRTERRGLVKKAQRHGYRVTANEGRAYFLRKSI